MCSMNNDRDSMKNTLDSMRRLGASESTINLFLKLFMVLLFIFGIGTLTLAFIQIIRNEAVSPWIPGILTGLMTIAGILTAVTHTTNSINGTAAAAASQTQAAQNDTAVQTQAMIQQVVAGMIATQKQSDNHSIEMKKQDSVANSDATSSQVAANTQATIENTDATIEQTKKESLGNG